MPPTVYRGWHRCPTTSDDEVCRGMDPSTQCGGACGTSIHLGCGGPATSPWRESQAEQGTPDTCNCRLHDATNVNRGPGLRIAEVPAAPRCTHMGTNPGGSNHCTHYFPHQSSP